MIFNSLEFAIFFPVVTILYFILNHKFRWFLLLTASCIFYMFFIPKYILILALTIAIDYSAGIFLEKYSNTKIRKLILFISIITTCGVLFYFKYYNFFIDNINSFLISIGSTSYFNTLKIILPIGLSFHTFQSLSYVIEVYLGRQIAVRHLGIYSLYVMYYPQLVAGPIERPQNLIHQFTTEHKFEYERFKSGMYLVLIGLIKKIVIADQLAKYVDIVYEDITATHYIQWNSSVLALIAIFFSIQIYCDFSGYSDMARGISRIMGIELMENFNRPYLAKSVTEFWQRWHISLSTWFRDYIYIPMGGNRVNPIRTDLNIFVTFLTSGLWHGANWTFVFWGGFNGVLLLLEKSNKLLKLKNTFIKRIWVFILMTLAWVFFRSQSIEIAFSIIKKILVPQTGNYKGVNHLIYGTKIYFVCLWLSLLLAVEIYQERFSMKESELLIKFKSTPKIFRWFVYYFVSISIIISWVETTSYSFIYFQF